MSLFIIDEGRRVRIPMKVEKAGPEAIEEFLAKQRGFNKAMLDSRDEDVAEEDDYEEDED